MSCKSETKTIDGVEYNVTQLAPVASVKMLHRIMKVLGPGAPVMATLKPENPRDPSNIASLLEGVSLILQNTDENDFMKLLTELVKLAKVNKSGDGFRSIGDLNEEFSGQTFTMFKVASFVVQVNFASFLGGSMVSKAVDNLKAQMASDSQTESPKKS